jgi:peptide/nickel transport system permease protein
LGWNLLKIIVWRLLALIPLLFVVALGSFFLIRLAPGDFLTELGDQQQITPETLSAFRQQYGLDQSWLSQFTGWLWRVLQGDFGYSFACNCPVSSLLAERLLNSVLLALAGLLLSVAIAIPLAVVATGFRARFLNRVLTLFSAIGISTPSFLLALLAALLAAKTGWFPIGGIRSLDYESYSTAQKIADFLHHLILPATVLAVRQIPSYFQQLRTSLSETLSQDYILTARAKGLPRRTILFKHALRNAVNPILSMLGNSAGALLSGAFVVEAVLSWPGIGSLAVSSLLSRDLYALLACLIYAAALLAVSNLLADLSLAVADPRIRRSQRI